MALVTKTFSFEACHYLPNHGGLCAGLHGHSYTVELVVDGDIQHYPGAAQDGMVVDYYDLSRDMKPIVAEFLDHKFLNLTLNITRTTAELIGCWIFGALVRRRVRIDQIVVHETANSSAIVRYLDWVNSGCPHDSHDCARVCSSELLMTYRAIDQLVRGDILEAVGTLAPLAVPLHLAQVESISAPIEESILQANQRAAILRQANEESIARQAGQETSFPIQAN